MKNLKKIRKKLNITQVRLSVAIEVSQKDTDFPKEEAPAKGGQTPHR